MSGDVFKSPYESISRFGDKITALDEDTSVAGGSFTGLKNTQELGDGFGNWYEGPGGESATKLGLAAIAMFGPGAALLGGMGAGGEGGSLGGGEVANSGMDFGGQGVGWNGELANSGMDFGGYGVGWDDTSMGGGNTASPYKGGGGFNWQDQARNGGQSQNQQQQQQPTGNPLINMLLQSRYQQAPFVPVAPGSLTPFMRG